MRIVNSELVSDSLVIVVGIIKTHDSKIKKKKKSKWMLQCKTFPVIAQWLPLVGAVAAYAITKDFDMNVILLLICITVALFCFFFHIFI